MTISWTCELAGLVCFGLYANLRSSDPLSPNYGKHWTAGQVHDMFAPSEASVARVRTWLEESGIARHRVVHSDNKGWLAFDASAEEMEELLDAEFYEFEHSSSSQTATACDE